MGARNVRTTTMQEIMLTAYSKSDSEPYRKFTLNVQTGDIAETMIKSWSKNVDGCAGFGQKKTIGCVFHAKRPLIPSEGGRLFH
jgi:hypothetical protein